MPAQPLLIFSSIRDIRAVFNSVIFISMTTSTFDISDFATFALLLAQEGAK